MNQLALICAGAALSTMTAGFCMALLGMRGPVVVLAISLAFAAVSILTKGES